MDDLDALIYPPGIKPSEATIYGQRSLQTAPVSNEPLIIYYKHSPTEAEIRILSCCRDLGISQTNAVKYPDLQRAYKLKFDIELGRDELFNLFLNRNATNSLKAGLQSFMHIIEASKTDDNTIRLKLKEDSDEYIKKLEARYEGPPLQPLTPEQVDSIFNPQKRENFYRNNRNENGRYYQPRGCGNGARYISRNNRNDGSQYPQQQQQYGNRYDGPQSLYDNRSYNNGGKFNYQNNYSQNPNFQRPFNLNQNPNNYSNNRYSQGPMAAFIDEQKKQKEENRRQMQTQMKLLQEEYDKQKKDHEEERERILKNITDECEENFDKLFRNYHEKLGEIEKHAIFKNKAIIKEFQKLKK